ncbi:gamma-glutamylcyclotransferase family protein [uncultured Gimesia sp.]|uniref:gamma-glutamylcyclotransferase family protein n=1 Tax=uncultured Gimesia sp. TaxID=1678688 RepID=UPI0030D7F320
MAELMNYFAYGSNLHPARLESRIGACQIAGVAQLERAALCFHKVGLDRSGKCDIVFRETDATGVWGVVYQISAAQKTILDQHESLGEGYQILKTRVVTRQNQIFPVYTYQAMSDYIDQSMKPFDWYHDLVLQGALFHGFPLDYLAQLQGVAMIQEHNPHRASKHQRLLETIRDSHESKQAD